MTRPPGSYRAIGMMVAAMACYVLNDTFVKLATAQSSAGQILVVRGAFATFVMSVLAWHAGAFLRMDRVRHPLVGARSALEVTTATSSVIALAHLPIADVTAAMMTAPLLAVLASLLLRLETFRPARLTAAIVGLAGVLLVLQPQVNHQTSGTVASLICALSLAARDLVTRRLPAEIPSVLVAWCATLAVPLAGALLLFGEAWSPMDGRDLACLGAAAVCAALGNYALIGALRGAEVSVVAPFRYTIILWALAAGYVGWGEVPNATALLGILLVAASGAIALRIAR